MLVASDIQGAAEPALGGRCVREGPSGYWAPLAQSEQRLEGLLASKPLAGRLQFAERAPCKFAEVTITQGVAPALIGDLQGEGAQLGG